ncbi:hypothetical protein ACLKA6_001855 [Drosophila palustris]
MRIKRFYVSTLLCLIWLSYGASLKLYGIHTDELLEGEGQLVVPRRVHADGTFMTHTLQYAHDRDHRRHRRSADQQQLGSNSQPELHFQLPLENETLHLELTPHSYFLAPLLVVERHRRDLRSRSSPSAHQLNCHFHGKVRGQPSANVAISTCSGLSLEVAHKLTFGYGYLTWEWVQGMRSYVYPLAIAALYKLLALLQLDSVELLVLLPRFLQALLTTYSDYRFYVWTGKRKWALFLILVPWFSFYTGSRTLANTLEASLITIALSYFPWYGEGTVYLWPAAISCFLRPTAAIIWLPLVRYHVRKTRLSLVELILKRFVLIGLLVAGAGIAIDTHWHGQLIVTPWEFLKYNILNNIGSFYGTHPWYWYFTCGLPTVLGINMLPFILGLIQTVRKSDKFPISKQLLIATLVSLLVLSTVEHKELRFVSSLQPLCLYVASDVLSRWSHNASRTKLWLAAFSILLLNALPAWYFSTIHQKGPIELMPKLREIAHEYRDEHDHRANILFLMPCHSTPYYSHIHVNVTMRFLTCEPNLQQLENFKDEADLFFDAPMHWLQSHFPVHPRTALPTHVVLFDSLTDQITEFLTNYELLDSIEQTELNKLGDSQALLNEWASALGTKTPNLTSLLEFVDSRIGKAILIYQRLQSVEENAFDRTDFEDTEEEEPVGHIKTASNEYYIEPSKQYEAHPINGHPHVVFQRSSVKPKQKPIRHRRRHKRKRKEHRNKGHVSNCGTREPRRRMETRLEWQPSGKFKIQGGRKVRRPHPHPHPHPHHHHYHHEVQEPHTKFKYDTQPEEQAGHQRSTRSISSPRHVETLIVADATMSAFHKDVIAYLLTIMNMVSALYKDPSIGNAIEIVVVRIIVLQENDTEPELNLTQNAQKNLDRFCSWQHKLNSANENDPHHHDVAILITRKNICGNNCMTLGLANVGGMCKPKQSCSVNEDNGIMLSHTITHELGHK